MTFDWWTLGLQTVNFAVLVWLLHRFLYKPVLRAIDARRDEIAQQYAAATAAEEAAKARLAEVAAQHQALAGERAKLLDGAAAQASEVGETIRAGARRQAAELLEDARKTAAGERDQLLAEARRIALDLGTEVAQRVLAQSPIARCADAWFEPVEHYLASLSKVEMDSLLRQAGAGAGLMVVTSDAPPDAIAQGWSAKLHAVFGDAVAIAFTVDPALISGVELHFPSAVLRFSGQSVLAALRAEIESHDRAA